MAPLTRLSLIALSAAFSAQQVTAAADLVAAVSDDAELSTLLTAVQAAGVETAVQAAGTLFAPTNTAFEAISDYIPHLVEEHNIADYLTPVLTYHVTEGQTGLDAFAAIAADTEVATLNTGAVLKKGAEAAELVDVAAQVITVDGTNTAQDNGAFLHKVDKVMLPVEALPALNVATFATDAELTNLLGLVTIAGEEVLNVLTGTDKFTIFAPTEAAIAAVNTTGLTPEDVATILKYHVVPGALLSAEDAIAAVNGAEAELTTASGDKIKATVDGEKLLINGNEVTTADIRTMNAYIHVIDSVLLPPTAAPATEGPSTGPTEESSASFLTQASAVVAASAAAALYNFN